MGFQDMFPAKPTYGIIALAASSSGDFRYRFGDPVKYDRGDPPSVLENWEKATVGHKLFNLNNSST